MSPGGSITITDENGITTSGHMLNNNEFVMSSLLRGTFSSDGRSHGQMAELGRAKPITCIKNE